MIDSCPELDNQANAPIDVAILDSSTEHIRTIPISSSAGIVMMDSCPEHVTEVEISSQEIVNATEAIKTEFSIQQQDDIGNRPSTVDDAQATAHMSDQDNESVITESETNDSILNSAAATDVVEPARPNTSPKPDDPCVASSTNAESSILSSENAMSFELYTDANRDHESSPVEPQSDVNDTSTVIDNLNLITQAMDARMLESDQAPASTPSTLPCQSMHHQVSMTTVPTATNAAKQVTSSDSNKRVGARCRSLLGQIRHLTERVDDNPVLVTLQDKLLDIVTYMESHVPTTSANQGVRPHDSDQQTTELVFNVRIMQ